MFLDPIGRFFKKLGSLLKSAFVAAAHNGLTDEVIALALVWVKQAAVKYIDNSEKREWVVGILVAKGIPESIARLAVELAVQLLHKELDKK